MEVILTIHAINLMYVVRYKTYYHDCFTIILETVDYLLINFQILITIKENLTILNTLNSYRLIYIINHHLFNSYKLFLTYVLLINP